MKKTKKRGPIPSYPIAFLIKFPRKTRELVSKIAKHHDMSQTKIIIDLVEKERKRYEGGC